MATASGFDFGERGGEILEARDIGEFGGEIGARGGAMRAQAGERKTFDRAIGACMAEPHRAEADDEHANRPSAGGHAPILPMADEASRRVAARAARCQPRRPRWTSGPPPRYASPADRTKRTSRPCRHRRRRIGSPAACRSSSWASPAAARPLPARRSPRRPASPFFDGDDLHSPEARAKMTAGVALDDDDRAPWLDRIGALLADAAAHPQARSSPARRCAAPIAIACAPPPARAYASCSSRATRT